MTEHGHNGRTHRDPNPEQGEDELLASDNEEGDLHNRPLHIDENPANHEQNHPTVPNNETGDRGTGVYNEIGMEPSALERFTQAVDNVMEREAAKCNPHPHHQQDVQHDLQEEGELTSEVSTLTINNFISTPYSLRPRALQHQMCPPFLRAVKTDHTPAARLGGRTSTDVGPSDLERGIEGGASVNNSPSKGGTALPIKTIGSIVKESISDSLDIPWGHDSQMVEGSRSVHTQPLPPLDDKQPGSRPLHPSGSGPTPASSTIHFLPNVVTPTAPIHPSPPLPPKEGTHSFEPHGGGEAVVGGKGGGGERPGGGGGGGDNNINNITNNEIISPLHQHIQQHLNPRPHIINNAPQINGDPQRNSGTSAPEFHQLNTTYQGGHHNPDGEVVPQAPTRPPGILTSFPWPQRQQDFMGAAIHGDNTHFSAHIQDPRSQHRGMGVSGDRGLRGDGDTGPPRTPHPLTPQCNEQAFLPLSMEGNPYVTNPAPLPSSPSSFVNPHYIDQYQLGDILGESDFLGWMEGLSPFHPTPLTSTPIPPDHSDGEEATLRLFIDTQGSSSPLEGHTVISASPIHKEIDHPTRFIQSRLAHLSIDTPLSRLALLGLATQGEGLSHTPPSQISTIDERSGDSIGSGGPGGLSDPPHPSSRGSILRTPSPCPPLHYSSLEHDILSKSDSDLILQGHFPERPPGGSMDLPEGPPGGHIDPRNHTHTGGVLLDQHRDPNMGLPINTILPSPALHQSTPSQPNKAGTQTSSPLFNSKAPVQHELSHSISGSPSRVNGGQPHLRTPQHHTVTHVGSTHRYVQTDMPTQVTGGRDFYYLPPRGRAGGLPFPSPSPPLYSAGGHTTRFKDFTNFGVQTDPIPTDPSDGSFIPPGLSRIPLFPLQGRKHQDRTPSAFKPIKIQLTSDPNKRLLSLPQEDDQESLATTNSVDTLLDQVKTLMTEAARLEVRAEHLEQLNERDILTPWATTVRPYPPYVQENTRLLAKIREVRKDAARRIQELAHADFDRQATRLQSEGETLISTIDGLMKGKTSTSVNARLEHIANLVGKTKSELIIQLRERRDFLAHRQPTSKDWDDFFRYTTAFRRTQGNRTQGFEITPHDRRQAEREDMEEVRQGISQETNPGDPTQPQSKKKRKREQAVSNATGSYRIPKKTHHRQSDHDNDRRQRDPKQHRQDRRNQRDPSPPTSRRRNQDFGDTRPTASHKTTYYRSDHDGNRGRDNHQNRGPSRTHTHQRHDRDQEERDRQFGQLQEQLDRLRRQ